MYGFGHDPEVPAGYQDADIEMRELEEQAREEETYTINGPVPYRGPMTRNEVHRTHMWAVVWDDEARECTECVAKEGSISAGWPCGTVIPRKDYIVRRDR